MKNKFKIRANFKYLLFLLLTGSFIAIQQFVSARSPLLLSWRSGESAVESLFSNQLQSGSLDTLYSPSSGSLNRLVYEAKFRNSASDYESAGKLAVQEHRYNLASRCFKIASTIFDQKGDHNMSFYSYVRAQRYDSQIGIFVRRPSSEVDWRDNFSHARLEPKLGCYAGAFIDNESDLEVAMNRGEPDLRRSPTQFNQLTGLHHSFFFIYLGYGKPFPKKWAALLKANQCGLQIAFEPMRYGEVKDNNYLRRFARDAANSGIPIFIRFASEMNGNWVPYHDSPSKYIHMFQTVSAVFHSLAPNVAMLWCPFEEPQRLINEYYPGDDAVDWVGVNIYSVLYNDNDPRRNAQLRNPSDQLAYVYKEYANKKPIAIGEYGASHMAQWNMKTRDDFAIIKMNQFYNSLKLIYPRVKMVNWLSMNSIKHAMPGRQLNDYSLLDSTPVLSAYHNLLQSNYFLKYYRPRAIATDAYVPAEDGLDVSGKVKFEAWIKTYTNLPTAVWLLDGKEISRLVNPGDYALKLNSDLLSNGAHQLSLVVLDNNGFRVGNQICQFYVRNTLNNLQSLSTKKMDRVGQ